MIKNSLARHLKTVCSSGERMLLVVLSCATVISSGCKDAQSSDLTEPLALPGSIKIVVRSSGTLENVDSDGYSVRVDVGVSRPLGVNDSASFTGLRPGLHLVQLDGVAPNCAVDGTNPRSVQLGGGNTSAVSFAVVCAGATGRISVTVVTEGADPDADGYTVRANGNAIGAIAPNDVRTFDGIGAGTVGLTLDSVADNCTVNTPRNPVVQVVHDATTPVAFSVLCVQGGHLNVNVATTGTDIDPDGYSLSLGRVGGVTPSIISTHVNGTATFVGLLPGNYVLAISGVIGNCDVATASRQTIAVSAGASTDASVNVRCDATTLLAFVTGAEGKSEIAIINSNGTDVAQLTFNQQSDVNPAWSPDGTRIAFTSTRDGTEQIYVMGNRGENVTRLTSGPDGNSLPSWSPDGTRLAFMRRSDGTREIYVMNSDGTNPVQLTTNGENSDPAWSPDGRRIAFTHLTGETSKIWVMNSDGSDSRQLSTGTEIDSHPDWSPDGSRIAFVGGAPGGAVFVMNADGSGRMPITIVSTQVTHPAWSPDGRKIAFGSKEICYDYYYYEPCGTEYIRIVGLDGMEFTPLQSPGPITEAFSQPVWRR
jgi:dipeptidyl aminopeptidase/acylaminoacyl peptidase